MRLLSFLLLTLAIVISAQSAFALPQMMGNPKSQASLAQPVDVKMRRPLHIEVSLDSPSTPGKGFDGTLEMGWLTSLSLKRFCPTRQRNVSTASSLTKKSPIAKDT